MGKYKRFVLKLSGEALAGDDRFGINREKITAVCKAIKKCANNGMEVGVVVGGGNFWRRRDSEGLDNARSDQIGMLATVMNAVAVAETLEQFGIDARVMTTVHMQQVAELYTIKTARHHLEKGRVCIFGFGTGLPFFTTDSAAAIRAAELQADVLLKATMVDGVYDKDPKKYSDAVRYDELALSEMLSRGLKVMDATAAALCMENNVPVLVFSIDDADNIYKAASGEPIGTVVR
jgi:uridylate kinase